MLVAILSLVQGTLVLTLPIYTAQIYQRIMQSGNQSTLISLTALSLLALAILALLDGVRNMVLHRAGVAFETSLGGETLAAAILNASSAGAGDVQGLRDLSQLRNYIGSQQVAGLFDLPFLPFYLLILFYFDPLVGFITLLGAVLLIGLSIATPYLANQYAIEGSNANLEALQNGQAYVRQAETVQALGLYPEAISRWGRANARSLKAQDHAARITTLLAAISKFVRFALQIGLICVGAILAMDGKIGPGVVFAVSVIGGRALAPVEGIIAIWRSTRFAVEANDRLAAVLRQALPLVRPPLLPAPQGQINIENVSYLPPGTNRAVVRAVSFSANSGECIGLVGPPGAGKSTLARLLVGAIQPSAGAIRFDGSDLRSWHPEDLGGHIGYLPQQPEFFPGTIAENIARMALTRDDPAVLAAAQASGAHDLITRLPNGYQTLIGRSQYELSGGQKQRIGLARAFYGNPRIFVLDEPNANLDGAGDAALREAIRKAKASGATVFIVAQRPSAIELADKIMLMREGAVEMSGKASEIMPRIVAQRSA